jgi:hypothetical protein
MNDQSVMATEDANRTIQSPGTVRCVPAPDWIEVEPYSTAEPQDAYVDNGLFRLLQDFQVNLTEPGCIYHLRTVQRVLTRAGAEKASHFAAEFDPSFDRLEVNSIAIIRGGDRIEHAKPEAFQVLRRETKLERLALNGRLTASLLVPDVRIDDVLEVSLTIHTNNPVLHGKYAGWMMFNAYGPWLEVRQRLLTPSGRRVYQKAFNGPPDAVIDRSGDVERSTWRLRQQERREVEDLTAPWVMVMPSIQFSEFETWNDVASLFAPLYEGGTVADHLAVAIEDLANRFPEPADRAAEWLRFVQRELRYFALALGEGGLVPRPLDTIWASRFGDCKDAARLYITGARWLGLDACAALTSTTHAMGLDTFIPSPAVFNHCIVRLRLNGATYWLDPTMAQQEGRLDKIYQPHIGWALPLSPETDSLERMGEGTVVPIRPVLCEEDVYWGPKPDSPARLVRRVHYFSYAADALRHAIRNEGASKYSAQVLKELQSDWPAVVETVPMSLDDDRVENRLTATFEYEIRNCWGAPDKKRRRSFRISDFVIPKELVTPKRTQRSREIFLGRPRTIGWRARLHIPCRWSGTGWNRAFQATGVHFASNVQVEDRMIRLSRDLTVDAWMTPAAESASYCEIVTKMRENAVAIHSRPVFGRIRPAAGIWGSTRLQLRAVLVLIWAGYLIWMFIRPLLGR